MATTKWAAGAVSSWTSLGFTSSAANSLAAGSAIQTSGWTNATAADMFMDVSGKYVAGGTIAAGDFLGLYFLPLNYDGSTDGDGTSSTAVPGASYLRATSIPRVGVTSGNPVTFYFNRIPILNVAGVWVLVNNTATAWNSSASFVCDYQTFNIATS